MKFATPRTWYRRDGGGVRAGKLLLVPLSWIWSGVTTRRLRRARPADIGVPVVCIGNLTLGGSGKTPVVQALAKHLQVQGRGVHILMRGHGGAERGPLRVDPVRHTARQVGDEALMLGSEAPVWIAKDRVAGARAAVSAGADLILMDDGHQTPSLQKTLSLVVVDGETRDEEWPFGDGSVFPAGPLREPLMTGLQRADGVILLLPADHPEPDPRLLALMAGRPLLIARLAPLKAPPPGPLVGFAAIAKPWKFERALKAAGGDLVDFAPFPDHAPIPEATLRFLERRATALGASLITTEKDAARLSPDWRSKISVWPVAVRFTDKAALDALLVAALRRP